MSNFRIKQNKVILLTALCTAICSNVAIADENYTSVEQAIKDSTSEKIYILDADENISSAMGSLYGKNFELIVKVNGL